MNVVIRGKPLIGPDLQEGMVLWRYLDAAQFFDLAHSQSLFLSRGDQFADKFEEAVCRLHGAAHSGKRYPWQRDGNPFMETRVLEMRKRLKHAGRCP
jgi:hypothetical protein